MVKRFTEMLLGYQLHQEVTKNYHFRDLPCPRCQGHSDWEEAEKDKTATGRRFAMDKGAFTQSQDTRAVFFFNLRWAIKKRQIDIT